MADSGNAMAQSVADFMSEWRNDLPYVIAHTSGSTGTPKEIRLLKEDMRSSALRTNAFFGITAESTLVLPLSPQYIAGKMMIVRSLVVGCKLHCIEPTNQLSLDCHADLLAIVPSQVDELVMQKGVSGLCRNVIIGGAQLSESRSRAVLDAGLNAYVTYGMTETCSHVALARVTDAERIYHALPDVTFATDADGCLVINVPYLSIGKVVTNDCVQLVDNRSFKWLGRRDNVINTGGIKVMPEQLEDEIRRYADFEFYVVGAPDEKWGERIELVAECTEAELAALMADLRAKLSHKYMPKAARAIVKLPRTANGKVKRLTIANLDMRE